MPSLNNCHHQKYVIATLSALCLSACGTVQSVQSTNLDFHATKSAGMTYFLPQKLVNLTIAGTKLDLAAAQKELTAAKNASSAAKKTADNLDASLKLENKRILTFTAGDASYIASQVKINNLTFDLAQAKVAQITKADAVITAQGKVDAAQKNPGGCQYQITHSLSDSIPDARYKFVAAPSHNAFRDDVQKLKVSKTGLLTSANIIADDRTDDIIADFIGFVVGGSGPSPVRSPVVTSSATPWSCPKVPVKYTYDPRRKTDHTGDYTRVNDDLSNRNIPVKIGDMKVLHNDSKWVVGDTVEVVATDAKNALFYRTPVPVILNFEINTGTKVAENWLPASTEIAMLPQAGPIGYIPMRSSLLVKTVNDVTFDNGVLTAWDTDNPSEVYGLISLPLKVAQQIIAIPASLVTLKVDYSSQQANLASNEARRAALLNCIASAGNNSVAITACLPAS